MQIFLSHKKDPIKISSDKNASFNKRNKTARGIFNWVKIEGANLFKKCEIGQKGVITKYNVFPSILVSMLCKLVPPDKSS